MLNVAVVRRRVMTSLWWFLFVFDVASVPRSSRRQTSRRVGAGHQTRLPPGLVVHGEDSPSGPTQETRTRDGPSRDPKSDASGTCGRLRERRYNQLSL